MPKRKRPPIDGKRLAAHGTGGRAAAGREPTPAHPAYPGRRARRFFCRSGDKTVFSLYPKARAKTLLKNALHTLGAYKGGALQYGLYYKEK